MFSNSITKNISWLSFDYIFKFIGLFLVGTLVARYLGPELFGKFAYAQSIILVLSILCSFGLPTILLKEFSEKDSNNELLFGSALLIYLFFISVSYLILLIIAFLYSGFDYDFSIMLLVFSIRFIAIPSEIWKAFFESKVQSKFFVISEFYSTLALLALQIYFVIRSYDVIFIIGSIVLQAILSAAILSYFLFSKHNISFKFNIEFTNKLIRKSIYLLFASFAVVIYMQLDRIMLSIMVDTYETGIYSAAMRIVTVTFIIPSILINSFFPMLINNKYEDIDIFYKRFSKIFEAVMLLSLAICIFIALFSEIIILTLYGSKYQGAEFLLFLLSLFVVINFYGTLRGKYLLAQDLMKYDFYVHSCALFLNFLLNLWLIPLYGAVGAVISTLMTGLLCIFFPLILMQNTRKFIMITLKSSKNLLLFKFLKRGYFYD